MAANPNSIREFNREYGQLCQNWRTKWGAVPDPESSEYERYCEDGAHQDLLIAELVKRYFGTVLEDARRSHFETPGQLWAFVTFIALPTLQPCVSFPSLFETQLNGAGKFDVLVQQVLGALHQLKIPWAESPPYPTLSTEESIDKLREIANRLEAMEPAEQSETPQAPSASDIADHEKLIRDYVERISAELRQPPLGTTELEKLCVRAILERDAIDSAANDDHFDKMLSRRIRFSADWNPVGRTFHVHQILRPRVGDSEIDKLRRSAKLEAERQNRPHLDALIQSLSDALDAYLARIYSWTLGDVKFHELDNEPLNRAIVRLHDYMPRFDQSPEREPYSQAAMMEVAKLVTAQQDRQRNAKFNLYRDVFKWFGPAMLKAGYLDDHTSQAVREVLKKGDDAWQEATGLPSLYTADDWQTAAIAANIPPADLGRLSWEQMTSIIRSWAIVKFASIRTAPPKPPKLDKKRPTTQQEKIREQRLKFCRPRLAKGMKWQEIYDEYHQRKAFREGDPTASPDAFRHLWNYWGEIDD